MPQAAPGPVADGGTAYRSTRHETHPGHTGPAWSPHQHESRTSITTSRGQRSAKVPSLAQRRPIKRRGASVPCYAGSRGWRGQLAFACDGETRASACGGAPWVDRSVSWWSLADELAQGTAEGYERAGGYAKAVVTCGGRPLERVAKKKGGRENELRARSSQLDDGRPPEGSGNVGINQPLRSRSTAPLGR